MARAQKTFSEEGQERGVLFIGSKWLQQGRGTLRVTFSKLSISEQQCSRPVIGEKTVSLSKEFQGLVKAAACSLRQLSRPKEAAPREVCVPKLLGEFR